MQAFEMQRHIGAKPLSLVDELIQCGTLRAQRRCGVVRHSSDDIKVSRFASSTTPTNTQGAGIMHAVARISGIVRQ
jgi:hypothetical protein